MVSKGYKCLHKRSDYEIGLYFMNCVVMETEKCYFLVDFCFRGIDNT